MSRHFKRPRVCILLLTFLPCWHGLRAEDQSGDTTAVAETDTEDSVDEVVYEETVHTGFVFLGHEYLPAPYLVQATADSVTVNGRIWPTASAVAGTPPPAIGAGLDHAESDDDDRSGRRWSGRWSGRWRGSNGPFSRWGRSAPHRTASRITEDLDSGTIIVAIPDQAPVYLSQPGEQFLFFSALLNPASEFDQLQQFLETRGSDAEQARWSDWIVGVTVSEELRARAAFIIEEVAAAEAKNLAEIRANQRLHSSAYPLTVLGMVLGVLALGHLLKSYSRLEGAEQENLLTPEMSRATTISIGLMIALSLFDLTWTLLASQAGQMRELNPLGSRLISDPTTLIVFKLIATLVACGILFALRHHKPARQACWWLCLICTVLTFRWVMFNSMFVA